MSQIRYEHTQRATFLMIFTAVALVGAAMSAWNGSVVAIVVGLFILAVGVVFSTLTIRVDETSLRWWFGLGALAQEIPLENVAGVASVRNEWWFGWGVRMTPHGWLFNVQGLDAVEITQTGGARTRLGTNEPDVLRAAIEQAAVARAKGPVSGG